MKVFFDEKTDALYLRFDENAAVADSEEIRPGIVLDFNKSNQLVGIEILSAKTHITKADLKKIQFEVA